MLFITPRIYIDLSLVVRAAKAANMVKFLLKGVPEFQEINNPDDAEAFWAQLTGYVAAMNGPGGAYWQGDDPPPTRLAPAEAMMNPAAKIEPPPKKPPEKKK